MRDSESRSRNKDRKDRDRLREREHERRSRRESGRERRDREHDYESRHCYKSNKYKNTKKYRKRNRSRSHSSSSSSSSSSYSSSSSQDSRSSHRSNEYSNARQSTTMPSKPITNIVVKNIDLRNEGTQKALETIEEDRFEQQKFYSTRDREAPVTDKVIIDLNAETVTISKPLHTNNDVAESKSLIHPRFLADDDLRQEKWIRKLFAYRQKYYALYDD